MAIKIGIPRGLLAGEMIDSLLPFLQKLGVETVLSPDTTREIVHCGSALAPNESCLSMKIYIGQVEALLEMCDQIVIIRQTGTSDHGTHCSRYKATYALATNIFRKDAERFLEMTVDIGRKDGVRQALIKLGMQLGFSAGLCTKAYQYAKQHEEACRRNGETEQLAALQADGLKVLVVAHSYVENDPMMGLAVIEQLRRLKLVPVLADRLPRVPEQAKKLSEKIPWQISNELAGGMLSVLDQVDGVLLLGAVLCGPDSMIHELICRKIHQVPVLRLSMDEVDTAEWLDVRLESFSDVISGRRKGQPCSLQK